MIIERSVVQIYLVLKKKKKDDKKKLKVKEIKEERKCLDIAHYDFKLLALDMRVRTRSE